MHTFQILKIEKKLCKILLVAISELQVKYKLFCILQVSQQTYYYTLIVEWKEGVDKQGKTLLLCAKNFTFGRHSRIGKFFENSWVLIRKKISGIVINLIPVTMTLKSCWLPAPRLVNLRRYCINTRTETGNNNDN